MNPIDTLKLWDTYLFLFINGFHAPFFDGFMYAVSYKLTWIPLYISVLYLVIKHWKREAIWVILVLILCIVISDQVSSDILKNLVKRLRPSHAEHLKGLVHLVKEYGGGKYGFASSHAANAFGFALLSSLLIKRRLYTYGISVWAVVTAYSRVYLGVHYPLDILGGIMVGSLAALGCYWIVLKFKPDIVQPNRENESIKNSDIRIPVIVLISCYLGICVYSLFFF